MKKKRIAIIDGVRTPMSKAGDKMKNIPADDLGAHVVKEIIKRTNIDHSIVDEVIIGNVAQPVHAANISRVIALKSGLPQGIPAYTVHRNCASGMESITSAYYKIINGDAQVIIAGGTESMSNIPLHYNSKMTKFFLRMVQAKSLLKKIRILFSFRFSFLKPVIGVIQGLTDPVSGLIMGETAEVLAREFSITRKEQDEYALLSHERAIEAQKKGIFDDEIIPIPISKDFSKFLTKDTCPRENQSIEALENLKPYFDRKNGTVTVGNSCPLTDGAAAVVLMDEKLAKKMKYKPLGYLSDFAYAGLEPERMGLGPVYATSKLFKSSGISLKDIDLIEMNEAFAAQIIANEKAFSSKAFAQKYLNRDNAIGRINRKILNVNGGAIALGHPVGMTGTRMVIHLLKELKRQNKKRGLATLCIGGGQGAALLLEVD